MTDSPQRKPFSLRLPEDLKAALDCLKAKGASCRLVGGCVRDALLGKRPTDFDVEVYGLELEAIARTLQAVGRTDLVGKSFAVVKLRTKRGAYDFSSPRTEIKSGSGHRAFAVTPDAHLDERTALLRRDFTLNALLYDPDAQQVIDYFGGQADLENRVLRHVSPAFAEDPLRALRALQFAGRFNLTLHPDTARLCQGMKPEYGFLAIERVWGEWRKWASQSLFPGKGLLALKDSGWIAFYPELNGLLRLPQDPEWHPEGDVFVHTSLCLNALVEKTSWSSLKDDQRVVLAFATLCHDLGKARQTRYAMKKGKLRWISPGHDQDSGWLSERFLQRIGAPQAIAGKVRRLVENHHFLNSFSESLPSDSSLRRLSNRIHPATTFELLQVMRADHLGRPPLLSEAQEKRLADFEQRIDALALKDAAPKPILKGRHLIALGMKPDPRFKAILDQAFDAQIDGAFSTVAEGIDWLKEQNAAIPKP